MPDPIWLGRARSFLGLKEIPGRNTNTTIAGWLAKLRAPWKDDETAWCGTFVAAVMSESGYTPVENWAGARKWLNYGVKLPDAALGCIVVFWRGNPQGWSGHVGFVVGKDAKGNLMVLGGNQGDMVSIKPFSRDRLLGFRWPAGVALPTINDLPRLRSDGKVSVNEA